MFFCVFFSCIFFVNREDDNTTQSQINSDLQRGLDRRLRHKTTLNADTEPVSTLKYQQNNTKQHKTTQNDSGHQNNTKQHKTTQNNTKQRHSKQHKTTQNNTKQHKTTHQNNTKQLIKTSEGGKWGGGGAYIIHMGGAVASQGPRY